MGTAAVKSPFNAVLSNEEVMMKSRDRTLKVSAPTIFIPKEIFKTKAAAIGAFNETRNKVAHFITTLAFPLTSIGFPHPRFGMLNGENWLIFIAGHCQRHVEQIAILKKE